MLYERMLKAKKNLGLEEKLILDKNNKTKRVKEEEVVIGQDYIDDCDYLDENIPIDIPEENRRKDLESPNDLDPDSDVDLGPNYESVDKEFNENLLCDQEPLCNTEWVKESENHMQKIAEDIIDHIQDYPIWKFEGKEPELQLPSEKEMLKAFKKLETPTKEEKEESMDILCSDPYKHEDTSGKTSSHVQDFLEKYVEGNDIIQVLRTDLMKVLSDMQWIKESKNQHEQFALDFKKALNELSL